VQPKRGRVIVGWRQVPVAKVRLRPLRVPPAPRDVAAEPPARPPDPADEKE
jgi:hypothetical protein